MLPEPTSTTLRKVRIGGLATAAVRRSELAQLMASDALSARAEGARWRPRLVFSSHGQGNSLAATDRAFAAAMAEADLIHADGMSVVMASKLFAGVPLPERVATTDFFHDAAAAAQAAGLRFFFLGADEALNAAACAAAQRAYPDLSIAGRHHGYFGREQDDDICRMIVDCGTDVLWLALGKPKQEFWAVENRSRLAGVGWIKTCGGLYGFLAGRTPRAPPWMQKAGLEWAYRAMQEPSRLGPRYAATNPHALWRMMVDSRPLAGLG